MKKALFLLVVLIMGPSIIQAQDITEVEFISPFHEHVAAVKKGDQWGFINTNGELVVDFRSDLVLVKFENQEYPRFNSGRCLMTQTREGIVYYGYINTAGETVIEPQFLNARPFNNNRALALQLVERKGSSSNVLQKPVVTHVYFEVVIDTEGEVLSYLTKDLKYITLNAKFIKQPIKFNSRLLSDKAFAIKTRNKGWDIKPIE